MSGKRPQLYLGFLIIFFLLPFLQRLGAYLPHPATPSNTAILTRSQPILSALQPEITNPQITATSQAFYGRSTGVYPIWLVECTDTSGNHLASLCWNATSGDILRLSCITPSSLTTLEKGRPQGREAVLQAARRWLEILGLPPKQVAALTWEDVRERDGFWSLWWRSGTREGYLGMEGYTCRLLAATLEQR